MECTLYLTDSCNLQCNYCYEADKKNKNFLNEEDLRAALRFIIQNNLPNDDIDLIFLGGEPLLNKKMLFKAVEIINSEYTAVRSLFRYQITTNGILLDSDTVKFLKNNNFKISISIDGTEETHNLNRRSLDGRSYYDIILKNIQYLIKKNIEFFVRMTLTANNVHLLFENILFFHRIGVHKIHIGIDYLGNWEEKEIKCLDEQLKKLDQYYLETFSKNEENM